MPEITMNLSLIVGLRNNLEYTKSFYLNVRQLYPSLEIVFVSYGSTDGTHEWLASLADDFVRHFYSVESKTLSDTYNKGVEIATGNLIAYLHNDMVLSEGFAEELIAAWEENTVLFYTVVEPPIFAEDKHQWKVVKDFGDDLASFRADDFAVFARTRLGDDNLLTFETKDPCFFLCADRAWLLELGGLDPLFSPMFCEDSDLLLRFKLDNIRHKQVPKAIAYHFVSKTSRFSEEYAQKTRLIEEHSVANFFRKWRFGPSSALTHRYDIAAIVDHLNVDRLIDLEPYVGVIYTDANVEAYIEKYQGKTSIDLRSRFKPIDESANDHGITLLIDMEKLRDKDFVTLRDFPVRLQNKLSKKRNFFKRLFFNSRKFRIGRIKVLITHLAHSENELIKRR
ncbi:glycosyltransferase family 2 protein [Sphingobacterium sp. LRF_L2]|uniref:glycosyltransferase family 2 protein n=1 Tax=Sphingobacterium sp. LRF_L2 TaxID=3369421 RepID=UPI003F5E2154